jgi:hypothetical protein
MLLMLIIVLVLQPMGKPRAVGQALAGFVRKDGEEDGGHADFFGADVDRGGPSAPLLHCCFCGQDVGAIHEEGRGRGG